MLHKVKVSDIRPNPYQVRKGQDAEAIRSLAQEIKEVGLWAGALRGRRKNGQVELCFGHRRLEAIRLLKWKEVEVDIVELTDEQMSLQGLVENLQREGLNDADKGDGLVAYIKLRQTSSNSYDRSQDIKEELRRILGLGESRFGELLRIAGFHEAAKEEIRQGNIGGSVAAAADRLGGEEFVKVAAREKLSQRDLKDIGKSLRDIKDETVKEKVREKVIQGKVTTAGEVVKEARKEEVKERVKTYKTPPDLLVVIGTWTRQIEGWTKQLDEVLPYLDYIDTEPAVAKKWREAVSELVARLEKFL